MEALQKTEYFTLDNESLSNDELLSIHAALSPSANSILRALYQNPNLQHKSLAADTHMSITNLSNCISKLDAIKPPLLKIKREGRSKFYSLSPIGIQYMERMFPPIQPAKIRSFPSFSLDTSKATAALQTLRHFQEAAGADWDSILYKILDDHGHTSNETLHHIFSELIDQIIWLKTQQNDESLRKIYVVLAQNILIKKLKQYTDQLLKCFYILNPVFQLEKQDYKNATFIIDDMFSEITFSDKDSLLVGTQLLTEAEYNAVYHQLSIMIKDFRQCNYNKKIAIEHWETVYHTQSPILSYIAEKCSNLYQHQKQREL